MTNTDVGRRTRQRSAISDYLGNTADFQTAQQVHDGLRAQGTSVSLPTIYRTLASMADLGEIDQLTSNGQSAYRKCSPHHHHHLRCRTCGCTIELVDDPVETWAATLAIVHGFTEISHITEITGLCPSCQDDEQSGHPAHQSQDPHRVHGFCDVEPRSDDATNGE
ncbi:MAG: transcriptional repressor [Propionibacteriaceae bacterium]|jgi:Fur family ferric uptake transcriptional regulator|nr:transcriptional repressor [Propionibacteriaceae bacterium]